MDTTKPLSTPRPARAARAAPAHRHGPARPRHVAAGAAGRRRKRRILGDPVINPIPPK